MKTAGTGFIVQTRQSPLHPKSYYLVTCDHCARKDLYARFSDNTEIHISHNDWVRAPSGADLVAIDVTTRLSSNLLKENFIDIGTVVSEYQSKFGVGDEIYMLCLHVNEADQGSNIPRARFGYVSGWASEDFPLEQGNQKNRPTHLGDMRSRTGFSGSPVFVFQGRSSWDGSQEIGLFGVHSDQFSEIVGAQGCGTSFPLRIPASMTKIVPAWELQFIENDLRPSISSKNG